MRAPYLRNKSAVDCAATHDVLLVVSPCNRLRRKTAGVCLTTSFIPAWTRSRANTRRASERERTAPAAQNIPQMGLATNRVYGHYNNNLTPYFHNVASTL